MCGRYASSRGAHDLAEAFAARDDTAGELAPDFNVAPTKPVPVVLVRGEQRLLRVLRWGLIPSWAKTANIGAKMINARAETLTQKPAYRKAFAARRCLLPADGYYEWVTDVGGAKQPFFHAPRDGGLLVMAGLYEIWHDPADPDPQSRVWSTTVITTSAPDDLGHIHDRAPMTVEPQDWARWLDPGFSAVEELVGQLRPAVAGRLAVWPVSKKVNSVKNNGRDLRDPIDLPPTLDAGDG